MLELALVFYLLTCIPIYYVMFYVIVVQHGEPSPIAAMFEALLLASIWPLLTLAYTYRLARKLVR